MSGKFVLLENKGHIAYVTLNRPERLNAVNPPMQHELFETLNGIMADDNTWVVIMSGAGGRAFCAGMDLKWRTENPGVDAGTGGPLGSGYMSDPVRPGPVGSLPTQFWKPIVAAVEGYAVGGGMEITLQCDVVIASESAQFGVPEIRNVGGFPGGGGIYRLPRQVPHKVAMWMLLSGQFMTAQYMASIGYVNEVVPSDKLMETAEKYANTLVQNAPLGVQTSKEVALRSLDMPLDYAPSAWQLQWGAPTARMRGSEDAEESRRAWLEKRPAVYHGR